MGIIDEASQCDIPTSIPIIKRSKNISIIGDDKQLSPITKISEKLDSYNMNKYGISNNLKYKDNSIFDVYKKISNSFTFLDRHYRSNKSIVEFSNNKFYDSKLKIMTEENEKSSIHLINVKGYTEYSKVGSKSGFNNLEINAILDYLKKLEKENFVGNIGIITPFRKQKELIEDKIIKKPNQFYQNVSVGTVHTFQGHEKDLIIFSTVVSKNAKKGSIMWLNRMWRLLNVAMTRAKNKFILIGDEQTLLEIDGLLRELILYITKIGNKHMYRPITIFDTVKYTGYNYNSKSSIKSLLNPYEKKLYDAIKQTLSNKKKYEVYAKVRIADVINVDQYKYKDLDKFSYGLKAHFDFVIIKDKNGSWPILAIELDGKYHTNDIRTIHRDKLKNDICRENIFDILRIRTNESINLDKRISDIIGSYESNRLINNK